MSDLLNGTSDFFIIIEIDLFKSIGNTSHIHETHPRIMNNSSHYRKDGAIAQLQKNFKKTSGDVSYDVLFKPIVESLARLTEGFLALTPEVEAGLSCGSEGYILHLCLAYLTSLTPVPGTDKRVFLPQFYGLYHIPLWQQGRSISEIADMITLDKGHRAIEAIMKYHSKPILRIIGKLGNNIRLWDHKIHKLDISEREVLTEYIRAEEYRILLAARECDIVDRSHVEHITGARDLHARLAEESWLGFNDVLSQEEKTRIILIFYDDRVDRGDKTILWRAMESYGPVASITEFASDWHPYTELKTAYYHVSDANEAYHGLNRDERFVFVFMQLPNAKKPQEPLEPLELKCPAGKHVVTETPSHTTAAKTSTENHKPVSDTDGSTSKPGSIPNSRVEFLKQLRGLYDQYTDGDGDMIPTLEYPDTPMPYEIRIYGIQRIVSERAILALYQTIGSPIHVNSTLTNLCIEVPDLKLAERILADSMGARWDTSLYLRVNGVMAQVILPPIGSKVKENSSVSSDDVQDLD